MTDKQIIDGIDVSKCQHYGKCSTHCYVVDEPCSDNPNCYYKQLAQKEQELKNICKAFDIEYLIDKETRNLIYRCNKLYKKEQECEALQMSENKAGEIIAELTAYKDVNEDFKTAWEELKAENEELKKELEAVYDDCKGCPTCNEAIYNTNLYAKECRELKQTLTEIKEIVGIGLVDGLQPEEYSGFLKILQAQILQKISECEVENDNRD